MLEQTRRCPNYVGHFDALLQIEKKIAAERASQILSARA